MARRRPKKEPRDDGHTSEGFDEELEADELAELDKIDKATLGLRKRKRNGEPIIVRKEVVGHTDAAEPKTKAKKNRRKRVKVEKDVNSDWKANFKVDLMPKPPKKSKRWNPPPVQGTPMVGLGESPVKKEQSPVDEPAAAQQAKSPTLNVRVKAEIMSEDDLSESDANSDEGSESGENDGPDMQIAIESFSSRQTSPDKQKSPSIDAEEAAISRQLREEQGALDDDDDLGNTSTSRYWGPDQETRAKGTHSCTRCGEAGHTIRECPQIQCITCGAINDHEWRQCVRNKVCHKCGAKGHLAYTCTATNSNYETNCALCGKQTHKSAACPTVWQRYIEEPTPIAEIDRIQVIYACYNCASTTTGSGHFGTECPHKRGHPMNIADPCAFTSKNLVGKAFDNAIPPSLSNMSNSHKHFSDSRSNSPYRDGWNPDRGNGAGQNGYHRNNGRPDAGPSNYRQNENRQNNSYNERHDQGSFQLQQNGRHQDRQRDRWSPEPAVPFARHTGARPPNIVNGVRQNGPAPSQRTYERRRDSPPRQNYPRPNYTRTDHNYRPFTAPLEDSDDDSKGFAPRRTPAEAERLRREGLERAHALEAERIAKIRPRPRGIFRGAPPRPPRQAEEAKPERKEDVKPIVVDYGPAGDAPVPISIPLRAPTAPAYLRGMLSDVPDRSTALFDRISGLDRNGDPSNNHQRFNNGNGGQRYSGGYY